MLKELLFFIGSFLFFEVLYLGFCTYFIKMTVVNGKETDEEIKTLVGACILFSLMLSLGTSLIIVASFLE